MNDELLHQLRRNFNLNLYEVRIWSALLSRGISTAGELSDIGNVPRSRAYDILESLEKKGFVMMKLGKPIKYMAIEPKEVVERSKKLIKENSLSKIKRLEDLKEGNVLKELDLLYKQGIEFIEPSELSGALRGRHNLYTHMESMIKKAQKSVDIMTTAKGLSRKVEALKPELEKLAKKGIKIRIAAPITKENAELVNELSKIAEIKNVNKMDARFAIVDNKELLFMVMNDEEVHPTYDVGVWVNTPYFATALSGMYNTLWNELSKTNKTK